MVVAVEAEAEAGGCCVAATDSTTREFKRPAHVSSVNQKDQFRVKLYHNSLPQLSVIVTENVGHAASVGSKNSLTYGSKTKLFYKRALWLGPLATLLQLPCYVKWWLCKSS